jgi:hypothetical protein
MTVDEPRARTDWVVTTGKNVIAPFVTSPPVVPVPRSRRRCRPFARLVNEVREQWKQERLRPPGARTSGHHAVVAGKGSANHLDLVSVQGETSDQSGGGQLLELGLRGFVETRQIIGCQLVDCLP